MLSHIHDAFNIVTGIVAERSGFHLRQGQEIFASPKLSYQLLGPADCLCSTGTRILLPEREVSHSLCFNDVNRKKFASAFPIYGALIALSEANPV